MQSVGAQNATTVTINASIPLNENNQQGSINLSGLNAQNTNSAQGSSTQPNA